MKPVPPPLLALAAVVAQAAVTRGAPRTDTPRAVAAGGLAVASGALAVTAGNQFRKSGTTVEPIHPERTTALVTSGPNSFTRNPMYLGLTGMLVANAIRRGAWPALIPVAAFAALIDRLQITAEEAALRAKFGADYEAYCAAVPRWLAPRSAQLARTEWGP